MDNVTCIFVRICIVLFLFNPCKCLMFKRLCLCGPGTVLCPHLSCCNSKQALELPHHMLILRCNTIWPTLRQKHVCWIEFEVSIEPVRLFCWLSHFQETERWFTNVLTIGWKALVSFRGTWKALNFCYMHGVTYPSVLIRRISCFMYTLGVTLSRYVEVKET
jgi:hypothetical protein